MTLRLTPDILRAAYDYLRETRPFCNWNLPEGEDVKFKVVRNRLYGYSVDFKQEIAVSTYRVGRTDILMETLAHEMIHLHLDRFGVKSQHGKAFHKAAAQVCREHGFDPKRFI